VVIIPSFVGLKQVLWFGTVRKLGSCYEIIAPTKDTRRLPSVLGDFKAPPEQTLTKEFLP
jgi:hypothetical protein